MAEHLHYDRVDSTNDIAKELIPKYPTLFITANYQEKGRGRKGKKWIGDSYKNVYLSFAINHSKVPAFKKIHLYQALGALAVKNMLKSLFPNTTVKLKYPNDVYVNFNSIPKKVCGILTEHSYSGNKCIYTTIGIGLNVFQEQFEIDADYQAGALKEISDTLDIDEITTRLKNSIEDLMSLNEENISKLWEKELSLVGKSVMITGNNTKATIKEILSDGRLRADSDSKSIVIDNGDSIRYEL